MVAGKSWAVLPPFDPTEGTVLREPEGSGPGYWVGAPTVSYDDGLFYLCYRVRRPRPDRGVESRIAVSEDGVRFEDLFVLHKSALGSESVERCCLYRTDDGLWHYVVSYVDPEDRRWRTDRLWAERPDGFEPSRREPVFTGPRIGVEGVKDPNVYRIGGLYWMLLSYAPRPPRLPEEAHATGDIYNTGVTKSHTGLATSSDGVRWVWEGDILSPPEEGWDAYAARLGTLIYLPPVFLGLYDGSRSVEENYEERCGLAISFDLRRWIRVTVEGPWVVAPGGSGSVRYVDLLPVGETLYGYYEMARPDGSHELRVFKRPLPQAGGELKSSNRSDRWRGEKMYEPRWESLDTRPCPDWYDAAKFGIFIHWGLYSVPAYAPKGRYAEWYWHAMQDRNGETWKFHVDTYGERFTYQDFVPYFAAELFDPDAWAALFERSGAQYVVLTSKHHDGFCLWPSAESWNWNSVDAGPHRDLLGDLTVAVRNRGLKMGFYYSLYEWFHPLYRSDVERYVAEHMLPQLRDAVERYAPSLIFADGEWEHPSRVWRSEEFLAWLFNDSPCRDEVVVNDRWGSDCRSVHGGYYTTEYGHVGGGKSLAEGHKWEENRGIGASFGYNRNETVEDYATPEQLIALLVDVVSRGGNLLLNVGPTADGRIPEIQAERLIQIGEWLSHNGEAIYGSRPWRVSGEGERVRYTTRDGVVYAICVGSPGRELVLSEPKPVSVEAFQAELIGHGEPLAWLHSGGKLRIQVPPILPDFPVRYAYVFKLVGVQ
ncbi:MAG: hypothetical protein KatS3mg115_1656 [Candidatus Poribacteria bacterium]|nr:MAG: hypothetical protein KatS3mg115_1656 [Candidatus Poribacteria bacterium]